MSPAYRNGLRIASRAWANPYPSQYVEHVILEGERVERRHEIMRLDFDVGEPCDCYGCSYRTFCAEFNRTATRPLHTTDLVRPSEHFE